MKLAKRKSSRETVVELFTDILDIIVSVYIILILAVMPFYFTNGYGRIGTNKYEFFYSVSTGIGKVFLPVLGIWLILKLWQDFRNKKRIRISLTDGFAMGYGVVLLLSYLLTDYKGTTPYGDAWKGSTGWYMGLSTQLLFLAVYFAVSRFWRPKKWILLLGILAGMAVFFLGYCNRFGIYPIEMEYAQAFYISTIGNINWFCGYVVTVLFGVLYYWWAGEGRSKSEEWILTIYCILGLAALVTQGSNSGLLTLLVMGAIFFLMSVKAGQRMKGFWLMMIGLSAVCSVTLLLRKVFPERYNFPDAIGNVFTYSHIPVIMLAVSVIIYSMLFRKSGQEYPKQIFERIGKIGVVAAAVLFVGLVMAIVINTLRPGSLGKLSELPVFTFDENWGSHRGATYIAGAKTWLEQDLKGKLFGVGPDCMAMYVHSGADKELTAMVHRIWGENTMLTNAHCEWLTVMVNTGLLGVIGFGGMILSAILRFLKSGKNNVMAAACGVGILAYTINNVVSFQQAMATGTMFILLGIGEAYERKLESSLL